MNKNEAKILIHHLKRKGIVIFSNLENDLFISGRIRFVKH